MKDTDDVAAAVVYNPEIERFLLLKRSEDRERFPGHWEFASGFIKEDETPEEAALRELQEETDLRGEMIRTGESFPIEIPRVTIHPVLITVAEDDIKLSREHSEYRWVERSDLGVLKTVPKLEQDLEKLGIS